jgi:hypothetical protein
MVEMNRELPQNFVSNRSICDKNTSIGAKVLWECGSEPVKRL